MEIFIFFGIIFIVFLILFLIAIIIKARLNPSNINTTNKETINVISMDDRLKNEYNQSIDIAQDIFNNKEKYVILDTETTGLGKNDVVVSMGIIDLNGNVLLNTLIKPTKRKRINVEATNIHGISMKTLKDAPTFKEIYSDFIKIIKDKTVLIYNNEFDVRLILQTCEQDMIECENFETICVMKLYAVFKNEWNDKFNWYKYPKLPVGDHTAIGDCKSTLKVLKKISEGEKNNN